MSDFVCYVAGFLIDLEREQIVLIRKRKPKWQRGRLNGVGGKVEMGEDPSEAMAREFFEEAGVKTLPSEWHNFVTVEGHWGRVDFYRMFADSTPARTMEVEAVERWPLDAIPYDQCLPNLSWIIPLALYHHDAYGPIVVAEKAP